MADKVNEASQAVFKAQNELAAKGFSAAGAGLDQMTGMVKTGVEATQVEAREARQAWDGMMSYAQTRNGKVEKLAREMTSVPASGDAGVKPEVGELVREIMEGDAGFYAACAEYVTGVEQRRVELMAGMLNANTALMESGQEVVKSAFDYGQALMEWSVGIAKGAPEQE